MPDVGQFSTPIRLLLTPTQRGRLLALCQERQADVTDMISEIVGAYLNTRTDLVIPQTTPQSPSTTDQMAVERQLRRLKMQAKQLGDDAPPWLASYITELEQEVAQNRQQ